MKVTIEIEENDIQAIKKIIQDESNNDFVKDRINIINKPKTSSEDFWHAIITGLLSSQQKSGPDSPVSKILHKKPFEFSLSILSSKKNIQSYVLSVLSSYKGIRFSNRISKFAAENYLIFNQEKEQIKEKINRIVTSTEDKRASLEKDFCLFLIEKFNGIGPKQSRNILQSIGLSKYEIPIDSRIIKWIKKFMHYELPLDAKLFSSEDYYSFTLKIIQDMCKKTDIIPAIFDACVFSSFDKGK